MYLLGLNLSHTHTHYIDSYCKISLNNMGVSKNRGTPKSSILIGCSIINHSFGIPLFLETPIYISTKKFWSNLTMNPQLSMISSLTALQFPTLFCEVPRDFQEARFVLRSESPNGSTIWKPPGGRVKVKALGRD